MAKINIYNDYSFACCRAEETGQQADTAASRKPFYRYLTRKTFETGIENDDAFLNAAPNTSWLMQRNCRPRIPGIRQFQQEIQIAAYSLETYTNQVLMPGMIVKTDAGKSDPNVAS
jgi:hypothetical protein